jgi:uncharacterized membrane protein YfcA
MSRFRLLIAAVSMLAGVPVLAAGADGAPVSAIAWWLWPLLLFIVCFALGIVAVPAGVGGGVLFVPIVAGFFPFHLDFVRGAGFMVGLSSALAASPSLLRLSLADLRLALLPSLLVTASQIVGALIGLALPAALVQITLGLAILGIVALMWNSKTSELPSVRRPDPIANALRINGIFFDAARGRDIDWTVHRTATGLILFAGIGVFGGIFGVGAGWANVPTLNLLMGAPLKVAAGTSSLILSMTTPSAAWVYINQGAMLPIVVVPSIIGIMLGALIGVRLLRVVKASAIRHLVIGLLLIAGVRSLMKGIGL